MNYTLDLRDYTPENALAWGNFKCHLAKLKTAAETGNLGQFVVQALFCAAEALPIISQIVSLFEMVICKGLYGSQPKKAPLILNKPSSPVRTLPPSINLGSQPLILTLRPLQPTIDFASIKSQWLAELPAYIEQQKLHKTYVRSKLIPINEATVNLPIPLNTPPVGITHFASNATFYGYNAKEPGEGMNGIKDYGWGCAWRAIQTSLTSYGLHVSFESLFHIFGRLDHLKELYQNKFPGKNLASPESFAPYEIGNGWAEPFIGHMAMHYYNLPSSLESINGVPGASYAPAEVFHNNPLTFLSFKDRLVSHFQKPYPAPIVLDDGTYTINIVGIGSNDNKMKLWIADPHINNGVYQEQDLSRAIGLYTVTIDLGTGRCIDSESSLQGGDSYQIPHLFGPSIYKGLNFDTKRWAVLFSQ